MSGSGDISNVFSGDPRVVVQGRDVGAVNVYLSEVRSESAPVGVPLEDARDPFALEVHRPITVDGEGELPVLPLYVRRAHDERLTERVGRAAAGHSTVAVLVAGSSAGKTRALWEALEPLRAAGGWRLWHPYDPNRPEAALEGLERVGPRTVLWLNETQEYLRGDSERVAAGLRQLLADPSRAPVLVLGTLWPEHYDALTRDHAAQIRVVLQDALIEVPEAFTGADLTALRRAAVEDDRLAAAAERAEDGQVTQYLAAGPELLERFRTAPPAPRALICAAMDARRMGHRDALPHALLEEAAQAYLTGTQWNALGDDWLEEALAYASRPCKGAPGPLTRIRPRAGYRDPGGPVYRLADFLEQYGRTHRADQIPPTGFWAATSVHAHPGDLYPLGFAAWERGLYREGVQAHKNATAHGDIRAAQALLDHLRYLHPDDRRPATWIATHVDLDDPSAVARLLDRFRSVKSDDAVAALLARAPASRVSLNNSAAVSRLLDGLHNAGATGEVSTLAERASQVGLDDLSAAAPLLTSLHKAGAERAATALAERIAAHPLLHDTSAAAWLLDRLRLARAPHQFLRPVAEKAAAEAGVDAFPAVVRLLTSLHKAGAHRAATVLAERVATHAALNDVVAVARLLDRLHAAGVDDQVTVLAGRAAAGAALADPALGRLLESLRKAGAADQVAELLARDPARHVPLTDPAAVGRLLEGLRKARATDQISALLARDPATHVSLLDAAGLARLIDGLRKAKANDHVSALLVRDPARHVSTHDATAVASLLEQLSMVGAPDQAATLVERTAADLPAAALTNMIAMARLEWVLDKTCGPQACAMLAQRVAARADLASASAVPDLLGRLYSYGAHRHEEALWARSPADHVAFNDPAGLATLLSFMRLHRPRQISILLARGPADHIPLEDPAGVAALLTGLLQVYPPDRQVAALLARDPAAHAALTDPAAVARLLDSLAAAKAHAQVRTLADRARTTRLGDSAAMNRLLTALRKVGAHDSVAVLAERLPAAGRFGLFTEIGDHQRRFRFGREPDGTAASPWAWDDLA